MKKPEKDDWMQKKWRPMMAIMYMMVCVFDFVLFPVMFTAVQFWEVEASNDAFRQWMPITLGGGGLFHVAMGAVLGVTAWSRGKEKMAGVAENKYEVSYDRQEPMYMDRPLPQISPRQFQEVRVGYNGKLAPPEAPQPLL